MIVLGINDGHDAGVGLVAEGEILYAANEERFSRVKMHHGFPRQALEDALRHTGVSPSRIDLVAFGGFGPIYAPDDLDFGDPRRHTFLRRLYTAAARSGRVRLDRGLPFWAHRAFSRLQRFLATRRRSLAALRELGLTAPVVHLDHHGCHAASAYYTAGHSQATIVTLDGGGDGLSGSIWAGREGRLQLLVEIPKIHSAGNFWAYITHICGFNPTRHGGKITGLAAYRPCPEALEVLRRYFGVERRVPRWDNRRHLFWQHAVEVLEKELARFSREEIAWGAQKLLEENVVPVVVEAVRRTGYGAVAVAGGVFANVRLNQMVMNQPQVSDLFVHPHMGDGGLGLGAALWAYGQRAPLSPKPLAHAYLGSDIDPDQTPRLAAEKGLKAAVLEDPPAYIASCLRDRRIVGLVRGRAEYGPRALCHRSILAEPTDTTMMDWLNQRLERTEFMPFAPVILEEAAGDYFVEYPRGAHTARFMTVCYDCTDLCRRQAPGVVHVDGTARPQVVAREQEPYMYRVLEEYRRLTGRPICVNTSFNRHEEPIVNSVADAVAELAAGRVDLLVVDRWLVERA